MIKTGNAGNVVLGIGDPSKFNLLGGSFGEAGDVVSGRFAGGPRLYLTQRDKMLPGGSMGTGSRGTPTPGGQPGGYDRDWRDRYRRER